jgi:hypothetical protein
VAVAVALAGGMVVSFAGVASAGGLLTADPCPPDYYGVIVGTDATGNVYACENIVQP